MRKYLALTAMATLFAGCVQDDGLFLQEHDAPISISSAEINDLRMSRAGGTPLTYGELGLYITGDGLDEKYTEANCRFTYRESKESGPGWYPGGIAPKPLFAGAGKQSAYAYYPYGCGFVNNESYTTNGATDLLWWKSETTLSEPTFPIDFDHALSKLTINLKKGNQLTSDIIGVMVEGTVLTATPHLFTKTWTIAQGAVSAPLSATEITTTSGMDATFSTLLIPQSTSALKITILTSSNQVFVYNHDSEHEFVQGTAYTLSLQVDEDRTYISRLSDITVNSWAEGGSLPEGGVAQPDDQVLSQVIDARGMSWDALNVAMTAALGVGKKNIEVIMEEEPASGMFSAIKGAISRAENVADGSISLTLSGVKVVPGQYGGYDGCLSGLTELAAVNLPNVTSIGDRAFYNCTNLSTITFPGTVKNIGGYAFHGTEWFSQKEDGLIYIGTILYGYKGELATKNVTIEDGTVAISSHAFVNSGITSVDIPASVKCIGEMAFCGESELHTISFAEDSKLESIGKEAFSAMQSLTSIEIPANVTSIGYGAFMDTPNLREISFAEGSKLESIGENAFFACGDFENSIEIEIPAGVKSIGNSAFYATPITSIEIPAGVTSIGDYAFCGCSKLQTISFAEDSKLETIGKEAFSAMQSLTSIEIPANVTSIGNGAFADTPNLRKISFADGSKLESIVDGAFYGCGSRDNPIEIEIPAGVKSIGNSAFLGAQLTAIEIPAGVTSIGEGAFHSTPLTSIEIPAGVTSIGDQTFMYCGQLQTVTILANQVVSLGEEVFEQSENITSIFVPADLVEDYKATADWRDYALKIKAIEN